MAGRLRALVGLAWLHGGACDNWAQTDPVLRQPSCDYAWTRAATVPRLKLDYELGRSAPPAAPRNVSVGRCATAEADGGRRYLVKLGPFSTAGGGSTVEFFVPDSHAHMPRSVRLVAYMLGVVDAPGVPVFTPPLLIHHAFLQDGHAPFAATDGSNQCVGAGNWWSGRLPAAHAIDLREPILMEGMVNDIRPAGAPALEWWLQSAIVAAPAPAAPTLVSEMYTFNPSRSSDFSREIVFPRHGEHVYYNVGRMPFAGTMLFAALSLHHFGVQGSHLLAGEPSWARSMRPEHTYVPIATPSTGFGTNAALREALLAESSPVCSGTARIEEAGGMAYDRCPVVVCRPWRFGAGQRMTMLTFTGAERTSTYSRDFLNRIPNRLLWQTMPYDNASLATHTNWNIFYAADDGATHYMQQSYSQTVDSVELYATLGEGARRLLWGGTPPKPPGFSDHAANLLLFLYTVAYYRATFALALLAACAFVLAASAALRLSAASIMLLCVGATTAASAWFYALVVYVPSASSAWGITAADAALFRQRALDDAARFCAVSLAAAVLAVAALRAFGAVPAGSYYRAPKTVLGRPTADVLR